MENIERLENAVIKREMWNKLVTCSQHNFIEVS
jgi:hypothetical protein